LKLRKWVVTGVMSAALTMSSGSVFAASIQDTAGLDSEMSINKLVSLGVIAIKNGSFQPDVALTRTEFASILNKVVSLSQPKAITIKDVNTKNGENSDIAKAVNSGLLKLNGKGEFNANGSVTYADFSRALAVGLGLKSSWTDRPIDYLFYLDRKGVLSIDTDLDAVVTREGAAVALDKFVELKNTFKSNKGVIAQVTDAGVSLNTSSGKVFYKFASGVSVFIDDQGDNTSSLSVGSAAEVELNKKGELAFISTIGKELEEGVLAYKDGKLNVSSKVKNFDLNAVFAPLPNNPSKDFTLDNYGKYSIAGVQFSGQAYINYRTDEVVMMTPYVSQISGRAFTVSGSKVTLDFSEDALSNLTFAMGEGAKATLDGKDITLSDLSGKIKGGAQLDVVFDMNQAGEITAVTATTPKAEEAAK